MQQTQSRVEDAIVRVCEAQRAYASELRRSDRKQRLQKLGRIQKYLADPLNEAAICQALYQDLRKPKAECLSSEIGVLLATIKHIKRHLREWMDKQFVPTSLPLLGARSYVVCEPKGHCLIIAPWNYPFQLAITPLLYAIAAGNAVIIKPSEYAPHTSKAIRTMIEKLFDMQEVAVFEGDIPVSTALLKQPFNHIHFTGSPPVGRIIMAAAATHLASVTLELGGKSPLIIDESAQIKQAAKRTSWGKFLNAGQTCIAPDYALVHTSVVDDFLRRLVDSIRLQFDPNGDGLQTSADYGRIINDKHMARTKALLEDAIDKGARIVIGGDLDMADRFLSPTVLTNVTDDMRIMQEEIFAPILPVRSYQHADDAVDFIRKRPKPLALYIHSQKRSRIDYFIRETSAGGTVINDFHIHYANHNLPFGGVNHSGIGKTHGYHAFSAFSNERAVMHQKWGMTNLIHAPYSKRTIRLLKMLTRIS